MATENEFQFARKQITELWRKEKEWKEMQPSYEIGILSCVWRKTKINKSCGSSFYLCLFLTSGIAMWWQKRKGLWFNSIAIIHSWWCKDFPQCTVPRFCTSSDHPIIKLVLELLMNIPVKKKVLSIYKKGLRKPQWYHFLTWFHKNSHSLQNYLGGKKIWIKENGERLIMRDLIFCLTIFVCSSY